MKIPREWLESRDALDLPCFRFRGNALRGDGGVLNPDQLRHVLRYPATPFAKATLNLIGSTAHDERLKPKFRRQKSMIVMPEVIFSCDPRPEAFTIVREEGSVQANLGFFLTGLMLSGTIDWLNNMMSRSEKLSLDDIVAIEIPSQIVGEMKRVLELWRVIETTGVCDIVPILTECGSERFARIDHTLWGMCFFVFYHEIAHWLQLVWRREVWEGLMNRTLQHLDDWCALPRDPFIPSSVWQFATNVLSSGSPARRAWAEEIQCDLISMGSCTEAFMGWQRVLVPDERFARQRTYVAQAMTYSLVLELQELYAENMARRQLTFETHPPTRLRRRIVGYINAKEGNMSLAQYDTTVWGSGTFVTLVGVKIMDAVREAMADS